MREPLIHSQVTGKLPETHPFAYQTVSCVACRTMVHASTNECMQAWAETGVGPFCLHCLALEANGVIDGAWGLSED